MKSRIIRTLVFCIFTIATLKFINFITWDDVHSLSRITMKEMYEQEQNIDVVMLGSSYVVHGFDPAVANEVLGKNTYNAGTKLQSPDGSYYLLKEILKENHPDTVYLECNHVIMSFFEEQNWGRNSIISVYMRPSLNRFEFTYTTAGLEGVLQNYFPFTIKRRNNFIALTKEKLTGGLTPKNYSYVDFEDEFYVGNGFVGKKGTMVATDNFAPIVDINPDNLITEFSMEYLEKITNLCKENGVRLVLMTMPMTDEMLRRVDNLEEYVNCVQKFADEHNIEYHNYNLARTSHCPIVMSDYNDKEHLNTDGARKFTKYFSEIEKGLSDKSINYSDVFWNTLSEKLENDPDDTIAAVKALPPKGNLANP